MRCKVPGISFVKGFLSDIENSSSIEFLLRRLKKRNNHEDSRNCLPNKSHKDSLMHSLIFQELPKIPLFQCLFSTPILRPKAQTFGLQPPCVANVFARLQKADQLRVAAELRHPLQKSVSCLFQKNFCQHETDPHHHHDRHSWGRSPTCQTWAFHNKIIIEYDASLSK